MNALFEKLNLKAIRRIVILDQPSELDLHLDGLQDVQVSREPVDLIEFVLAFAPMKADVARLSQSIAGRLAPDAVVWFAYPKGSSRRYRSDYNRDSGWDSLGAAGLEPVRQVSIDEDWSALRFRPASKIKRLTRDPERMLSDEGKSRRSGKAKPPK
jgi:hypothetical protein